MREFVVLRPDKPFESWISEEARQKQNQQRSSNTLHPQSHPVSSLKHENAINSLDRPDKKPM